MFRQVLGGAITDAWRNHFSPGPQTGGKTRALAWWWEYVREDYHMRHVLTAAAAAAVLAGSANSAHAFFHLLF